MEFFDSNKKEAIVVDIVCFVTWPGYSEERIDQEGGPWKFDQYIQ
jgi:hypothetical protein